MLEAARFRAKGLSLGPVHRCVRAEAALEGRQPLLEDFCFVIKIVPQKWDEPLTGHIPLRHAGRLGTYLHSSHL